MIVEHLSRTKIDGAAFWLSDKEPVVVLSIRHDRIDGFWYTLGYELGHIYYEDKVSIDTDLVGENSCQGEESEIEIRANEFGSQLIVAKQDLDDFIVRTRPLYAKNKIIDFATRIRVHPGIVVGQLQHRKEISYGHSREMLEKVRNTITGSALTDSWGQKVVVAV